MLAEDLSLVDISGEIWRLVSLREKKYTFNSHCHKSYSRIDFLLIPHPLLDLVVDCKIGAIVRNDHGMVELHVDLNTDIVKWGHWRLHKAGQLAAIKAITIMWLKAGLHFNICNQRSLGLYEMDQVTNAL